VIAAVSAVTIMIAAASVVVIEFTFGVERVFGQRGRI
jgi:hypothetical protein